MTAVPGCAAHYGSAMGEGDVQVDRATGLPVSSVDLLRRRIINVVGHELRTPVTTVRGLAEALAADDADDDERRALLAALVRATTRLESLVDEVLLASSIGTAMPVGAVSSVDLVAAARAAWAEVGVTDDLDVAGAAIALAQPAVVHRVLAQVLANAASHGAAPYGAVATSSPALACIAISSGGDVLRPDELALATEAFFRGEAAVTNAPGLGLGLAVARTLVEGSGGTIGVEGAEGGGMVVTITLPVAT